MTVQDLGLPALIVRIIWVVEVCVGISAINQGQASSLLLRCHPLDLPLIISVVIGAFVNSSHSFDFLLDHLGRYGWLYLAWPSSFCLSDFRGRDGIGLALDFFSLFFDFPLLLFLKLFLLLQILLLLEQRQICI